MEIELETIEKYAVVVAGGKGLRMGSKLPKQFIPLAGLPILMRTLQSFHAADPNINIVLVLPTEQDEFWQSLVKQHSFTIQHSIVHGGATRFQSVKNGLGKVSPNSLVAVHDGVRPFVSRDIILNAYRVAYQKGSAVTAIPLKDSIRQLGEGGCSTARDRKLFKLVQTPQTFLAEKLIAAYQAEEKESFTDCASVFEADGNQISLVDGAASNIKITTPEDLLFGEVLATRQSE